MLEVDPNVIYHVQGLAGLVFGGLLSWMILTIIR